MDDFTVYGDLFDECLDNLTKVLKLCLKTNIFPNYEECHFMVDQWLILVHVVSSKGIEVDKAKVDVIKSLPHPKSVREVRSFLINVGFIEGLLRTSPKSPNLCKDCYKKR